MTKTTTHSKFQPIVDWLQTRGARDITPLWIINGLAVSATAEVIGALAARPDVARISLDEAAVSPRGLLTAAPPAPPDNLQLIGAPEAWARGFTGQGVVVAVLDSGVDLSHPDLSPRWRGGPNSWYDPYGQHPDGPVDISGHGTQVLGAVLGAQTGVAPGAQWIAARVFDDRGRATVSAIHLALQWVLDPDGDPATRDAPQVVNNSWSFTNAGCDDEFAEDLQALRAAGILPVFAAGLGNPLSPAEAPQAFAAGALAVDGLTRHPDSPAGPSFCGKAVFPDVAAPGAGIRTTDRFGMYHTAEGTSLAAAHVSGALALLLSARPGLSADEQERLLRQSAVDLGAPGPDSEFGYGRLDVAAALDELLGPERAAAGPPQANAGWWLAAVAGGVLLLLGALGARRILDCGRWRWG